MRLCLLNYSLPTLRPNCASRLLEQATKWHGRGHSVRQQLSGSVRMDTRLWFFSILLFRRINNLRRINPPEGFDSHPGNFLERDFWTAFAVKIEVKFLLFTSNRNRARLLYVTHSRASRGKQDVNPSSHARPDVPASAAGHGPA